MAWESNVKHVKNGEEVSASVAGRPDRTLTNRTDYLKNRLDEVEAGQTIVAYGVTLDEDLLEGQPAFFNSETQRFEPALAVTETDAVSNSLVAAPSSDCVGVVLRKENSTKGDLLLFGYAELSIENAAGAEPAAGRYYVSGQTAGTLTRQRPPATVQVLFYDGNGRVFVAPYMRNFVEDHVHFSFDLVCRPAGSSDQPEAGQPHVIHTPDASKAGWLPAGHDSFNGAAPARAAFGYNLAAHPELQRSWPPLPLGAAAIVWDRGNNHVGGNEVPLGSDGLVMIDRFGIWWMSDCYADVPWPLETSTSLSSYPSEPSLPESQGPECPRWEKMRLRLSYVRMAFATDKSVVTRLQPFSGSPIRFVDCDGNEADTGDLFAKFVSEFAVSDSDADGNIAIKELDGGSFKRGWMVQGVRSGNANLTVTGTRTKEIGEEEYSQGLLTLNVNLDPAARDLAIQLVSLRDAKERSYLDLLYIGLPAGKESTPRFKMKIPGAGLSASPQVKIRVQILGRATGTLPDLDVSYRIVPRPGTPTALPTVDTALVFSSSGAITLDQYREVESESITVAAGDTVFFTIGRASSDGYSGEIGLLDVIGVLN